MRGWHDFAGLQAHPTAAECLPYVKTGGVALGRCCIMLHVCMHPSAGLYSPRLGMVQLGCLVPRLPQLLRAAASSPSLFAVVCVELTAAVKFVEQT